MRIKIEGCTAEALEEEVSYLTLGKEYEVVKDHQGDGELLSFVDDEGDTITALRKTGCRCAFLPRGAEWVVVE